VAVARAAAAAGDGPGLGYASIGSQRIATLSHPNVGALPLLRGVTKLLLIVMLGRENNFVCAGQGGFARTGTGG